jgi:hypothetical protein
MELESSFFAFCLGLSDSTRTSQAAEKGGKYHLVGAGSFHAQRPPRQPAAKAALPPGSVRTSGASPN